MSQAALQEVWNDYVRWRRAEAPRLPAEERHFSMRVYEQEVWVLEDGSAFTILYPADY